MGGKKAMIIWDNNYNEKLAYPAEKFTFDQYLVDKSNEFAYKLAKNMVVDGWNTRNTLIIHGKLGVGKSHLAYSMLRELVKCDKTKKVCCVNGYDCENTDYMSEILNADGLFVLYADLILEDEEKSKELLKVLHYCWTSNKLIILTMNHHPDQLKLRRNEFGDAVKFAQVAEIKQIDESFGKRLINHWIIRNKIEKLKISDDVIEYIVRFGMEDIRTLYGTLNKVVAISILDKKEITLSMVKDVLSISER